MQLYGVSVTSLNRTALKAKFESGDSPQGSDYSDLIDSFVSLSETDAQVMQGNLSFSGGFSAASITAGAGTFTGSVSAPSAWVTTVNAGSISAQSVTTSSLSSPASGISVGAHLNFTSTYIKESVASVACISTTQAAGYAVTATINILRTVSTGAADAMVMPGFYPGARFVFINNTTGSAQLFPPVGGSFDGGSTNASISIGPKGGAAARVIVFCETSAAAHSLRGTN